MFSRGLLLVAVLVAAVAIPYFMMNDDVDPGQRLAGLWDSMFHAEDDLPRYGNPTASASPIPPRSSADRTTSPWRDARWSLTTPPVTARSTRPTAGSMPGLSPGVTIPPWATATPWMPVDRSGPAGALSTSSAYPAVDQRGAALPSGVAVAAGGAAATRVGPAVRHVGELFRFDITPDWVVQNWPRVSSQLADFSHTGLRVPVVSGTSIYDLAGALTYYFDGQQQLQRVTILGTTGDPTPLVQLATTHFKMEPQAALNGRCFVARTRDVATDMLRVQHVAVAIDHRPHQRYKIIMELNRAGNAQGLSAVNARLLEHERKVLEASRANAATP